MKTAVALTWFCATVKSWVDLWCEVVHTAPMDTSNQTRIRLTISVTPEVHAVYTRLAKATGSSIGREMGDFLHETLEAVEFTATKMEQARVAPRAVLREMHAYALGLADDTGGLIGRVAAKARSERGAANHTPSEGRASRVVAAAEVSPPSSNTGGKGQAVSPSPKRAQTK